MTAQELIYYYYSAEARTIFWSTTIIDESEFSYLGSSTNPKKIMAATVFATGKNIPIGWKLSELIN